MRSIIYWSVVDNSYEKIYDMMFDLLKNLINFVHPRADILMLLVTLNSLENFIYTRRIFANILGQLCSSGWRIYNEQKFSTNVAL